LIDLVFGSIKANKKQRLSINNTLGCWWWKLSLETSQKTCQFVACEYW